VHIFYILTLFKLENGQKLSEYCLFQVTFFEIFVSQISIEVVGDFQRDFGIETRPESLIEGVLVLDLEFLGEN